MKKRVSFVTSAIISVRLVLASNLDVDFHGRRGDDGLFQRTVNILRLGPQLSDS